MVVAVSFLYKWHGLLRSVFYTNGTAVKLI